MTPQLPVKANKPVSRRIVATGIAATIVIGAGAFVLSFSALTDLAVRAGINQHIAWMWPLIVDGMIVAATVAIVALAGRGGREQVYPWVLLFFGAIVSTAANSIHAILAVKAENGNVPVIVSALVAAMPPVVLLAITHLTVLLVQYARTTAATQAAFEAHLAEAVADAAAETLAAEAPAETPVAPAAPEAAGPTSAADSAAGKSTGLSADDAETLATLEKMLDDSASEEAAAAHKPAAASRPAARPVTARATSARPAAAKPKTTPKPRKPRATTAASTASAAAGSAAAASAPSAPSASAPSAADAQAKPADAGEKELAATKA